MPSDEAIATLLTGGGGNRYIYLPRLKNQDVLIKAVQASVSAIIPGPFAYAEQWDEKSGTYWGLAIDRSANAAIVMDSQSVIVTPAVAEAHRPGTPQQDGGGGGLTPGKEVSEAEKQPKGGVPQPPPIERKLTRFTGTVMISSERPAREIHQIVEAIVEQLTTLPGSSVKLKLEIDAEVPSGPQHPSVFCNCGLTPRIGA